MTGTSLSLCQSAATSGLVVGRSLLPTTGTRPLQAGHPLPATLDAMVAFHTCLRRHLHCTFRPDPAMTVVGSSESSHCAASTGCVVGRSFTPTIASFPLQYGHPVPLRPFFDPVRSATRAVHVCLFRHFQSSFLDELHETVVASTLGVAISDAMAGWTAARDSCGNGTRPAQRGHPDFMKVRLATVAFHSYPHCLQCQGILRPEYDAKVVASIDASAISAAIAG